VRRHHRNPRYLTLLLVCGTCASLIGQQASRTLSSTKNPTKSSKPALTGSQAAVEWIRSNAIPLQTVEAGHGFADMAALKNVVGDARIVALGEATHGTREFFQFKHRMVEFLATQKGFTIFSIEANMPEAYRLNDFVLTGKGDPKELIKGMYFWTWNTQEVLDMVLWMRDFNQSGKGHIEFTGFDMQTPTVSMEIVRDFVQARDGDYFATLDPIYRDVSQLARTQQAFGVATATFPVHAAAGKRIKYSGFIRTEGINRGWAGLWWRADSGSRSAVAFDNMQDRGAKGTTPWTRYEISLDVPTDATNINFGILHTGDGTAWFDSLQVEIDGVPYTSADAFDLDFESPSPRGFYTGGKGYEIKLDNSVARTGKQSLRFKFTDTEPQPANNLSKDLVVRNAREVVKHLEDSRARFLEAGVTAKDLDWTAQNARLVLQYSQLTAGEKSRDESMAENVKWIADHNPGAKMALWAHNGHVQYQGPGWYPMGEYLGKLFPGDLVNFGFVFNQGSFRAIETGKGLREFTVGGAPEGSLDQTLAAAGIPILALDLHRLPKSGPVAEWFDQPHASRSIGAVYSEDTAASYFLNARPQDEFDTIVFVNKTSAARGN
jgi:erythromycin esterase-like protein